LQTEIKKATKTLKSMVATFALQIVISNFYRTLTNKRPENGTGYGWTLLYL
jgi:hypothetical protein